MTAARPERPGRRDAVGYQVGEADQPAPEREPGPDEPGHPRGRRQQAGPGHQPGRRLGPAQRRRGVHQHHVDQDASTLDEVPGITGPLGTFGQQADHVTIDHLRQNNWATSAGSFTLPGMSLGFSGDGC